MVFLKIIDTTHRCSETLILVPEMECFVYVLLLLKTPDDVLSS